jgi:hypothetical protein
MLLPWLQLLLKILHIRIGSFHKDKKLQTWSTTSSFLTTSLIRWLELSSLIKRIVFN